MKSLLAVLIFVLMAVPAFAQDLDKGKVAFERGDYAAALRNFRPLAEQGYARAQYHLGQMYEQGRGVSRSDAEAAHWYRKAAEQGDDLAQYNLGVMYEKGLGVPQDHNEAEKWYRKAAVQGNANAQRDLLVPGDRIRRDLQERIDRAVLKKVE